MNIELQQTFLCTTNHRKQSIKSWAIFRIFKMYWTSYIFENSSSLLETFAYIFICFKYLPAANWSDTPLVRHSPCAVHAGIRSTSGRYASHWNAFLFIITFTYAVQFAITNDGCSKSIQKPRMFTEIVLKYPAGDWNTRFLNFFIQRVTSSHVE